VLSEDDIQGYPRDDDCPDIVTMAGGYQRAKAAPVGALVTCPVCLTVFTKSTKAQAFCSCRGAGNCKDRYHNSTSEARRERARLFA